MAKNKREQILQEADKLAARGKLDGAIKEYRRALDQAPTDTNTLNRLGDLLVKADRIDEAVEVYQKIAEHFADDGFFLKAIAIFKKINRFDPQRTEIYERLADLYYKQGLAVEGRQQLLTLADWHLRSNEHEDAIRVYRKLADLEPTNFQSRAKLVDVLIQQGDVEAVTDEIDDLGQALLERSMMDEAVKLYHRAIELHPQRGNFVARCLDALLDGARVPQAVDLAGKALTGTGGGIELKRAAGQVFAAANQLDRAKGLLEEIFPQAAERFEVVQAYADVLLRSDDLERAQEVVLPAIDRLIGARDARRAASLLKRLLRKSSDSIPVLERAARVFDKASEPEVLQSVETALADAYRKAGRGAEALPIYRRLVEANPSNKVAVERLAELEGGGSVPAAEAKPTTAEPVAAADTASEIVEDSGEFVEVDLDALEPPPTFDEDAQQAVADEEEIAEPPAEAPELPAEEPSAGDTTVEELFTEATVFAKYGLADKAIMHLQRLLEVEPSHTAAHELLASLAGGAPEVPPTPEPATEVEEPEEEGADVGADEVAATAGEPAAAQAVPTPDQSQKVEATAAEEPEPEGEVPVVVAEQLQVELPDELFEPIDDQVPIPEFDDVEEAAAADASPAIEQELPSFEVPATEPAAAQPADEAVPGSEEAPWQEGIPETEIAGEPDLESAAEPPPVEVPVEVPVAAPPVAPIRRAAQSSISLDDLEAALGIARTVPTRRPKQPTAQADEIDLSAVLGEAPAGRAAAAAAESAAPAPAVEPPAVEEAAPASTMPGAEGVGDEALEAAFAVPAEEEIAIESVEVAGPEEDFVDVADVLTGPDEERLREIDFLIEQGLLDDAGKILAVLREESGDHPEIGSRQAALKARGWDESAPTAASDTAESLFSEEEQFFDLAAELERELADEELVAEATGAGQGAEVSIEELFKEFQRGVAEQVSEEDFDTHFNLGLAYREMGLFDEAIGEFQLAGKSPTYMIECATMIGACYMDKGLPEQAADWYDRALRSPDLPAETELGLRYELGRTQEAAGNSGAALSYYAEVLAINPGFRDVVDRVSRLQSN